MKDSHWDATVDRPIRGRLEHFGRNLFYRCASRIFSSSGSVPFSWDQVQKILVIKEPYRMGDLIQITPTLHALKSEFPQKRVGLVIQDRNEPIFRYSPHVDDLFLYKKREINRAPWKFFQFLWKLRRSQYDLAITLETERVHLTNDLIAFGSGAKFRMRYDGKSLNHEGSNLFYNLLVPFDRLVRHQVDKNFSVLKPFGLQLKEKSLVLQVSDKEIRKAQEILQNRSLIVIHPGAYKLENRWPLENYFQVAKCLTQKGWKLLFTLGPSEMVLKKEILQRGYPIDESLSILEAAALFKFSRLVLTNDTGMMHVSAAVGAMTLSLFAQTDPLEWKPPGDKVFPIQSLTKDIRQISVESVVNKLQVLGIL